MILDTIMCMALGFTIVSFFAVLVESHNSLTVQSRWLQVFLKTIFWLSLATSISSLFVIVGT